MMKQKIFPSVIAKNQLELNKTLTKLAGVAKELHLDIVDGKFAPNHSLDFKFRLSSKFSYNAHLMIKNPLNWIKKNHKRVDLCIPQFCEVKNIKQYIAFMKQKGKKVAFALKPETKVASLKGYLAEIDAILILTVHPGFYGAKYLKGQLEKIKQIKKVNSKIKIIVDGHMNDKTAKEAKKARADYLVSGSFIMKAADPKKAIKELNSVFTAKS